MPESKILIFSIFLFQPTPSVSKMQISIICDHGGHYRTPKTTIQRPTTLTGDSAASNKTLNDLAKGYLIRNDVLAIGKCLTHPHTQEHKCIQAHKNGLGDLSISFKK